MLFLAAGTVAFLLFYLYELHTATGRFPAVKPFFFIGLLLLFCSTGAAGIAAAASTKPEPWRLLVFGSIALAFFALLLHALFFAIPFSKTYVEAEGKHPKKACQTGVYALCRHPGVLWFMGFYLFLWLAVGGQLLLSQFVLYSALNLLYIILQDRWSFLKCFENYREYQKNTPFLIPNKSSVKRCLATLPKSKRRSAV